MRLYSKLNGKSRRGDLRLDSCQVSMLRWTFVQEDAQIASLFTVVFNIRGQFMYRNDKLCLHHITMVCDSRLRLQRGKRTLKKLIDNDFLR